MDKEKNPQGDSKHVILLTHGKLRTSFTKFYKINLLSVPRSILSLLPSHQLWKAVQLRFVSTNWQALFPYGNPSLFQR